MKAIAAGSAALVLISINSSAADINKTIPPNRRRRFIAIPPFDSTVCIPALCDSVDGCNACSSMAPSGLVHLTGEVWLWAHQVRRQSAQYAVSFTNRQAGRALFANYIGLLLDTIVHADALQESA
jgi:hypothetical protein